jgi:hypothetical protein
MTCAAHQEASAANLPKIGPISDGKFLFIPNEGWDAHQKFWTRVATFRCSKLDRHTFAHSSCACNEYISIAGRVIGEVPKPTKEGLARLRKIRKRICARLPLVPEWELDEMPMLYSGRKRDRYLNAAQHVREGDSSDKDARITMFVKFEKSEFKPSKINPDPRAIQFRGPKYCVELARYLKPIEHVLYNLSGDGKLLPAGRLIGKGLSMERRARLCVDKFKEMTDTVVLSLDAKRFDQHCSADLLKVEHDVYLSMNNNPRFRKLLSLQLDNKGTSGHGIKYMTRGKRMSGDMNTALGNCVLMVLMVTTALEGIKHNILDDGDDVLVFINGVDYDRVMELLKPAFLSFGHEITVEGIARELHEIEWCQAKLVEVTHDQWKFVRTPAKVIANATCGTKYVQAGARGKLLNTVGLCETIVNAGVPILQEFGLALMRNSKTQKILKLDMVDKLWYRVDRELGGVPLQVAAAKPQAISESARLSFSLAFGITPFEQVVIEEALARWTFDITQTVTVTGEYDTKQWITNILHTDEVTLAA